MPLTQIFAKSQMRAAFERVFAKGKSGGIDNETIASFKEHLEENLDSLQTEILNGSYIQNPYKRVYIPKNKSEKRPLALLTIRDKIAQHCVLALYEFGIDKQLTDGVYAYRIGKGHTHAINRITDYINRKFEYFALFDIDNFFDSIDRRLLLQEIKKFFPNDDLLPFLEMWIRTGVMHRRGYSNTGKGIAQGGVLSPLFSNIYLHSFDQWLKQKGIPFVRYADNILLLGSDKQELANRTTEAIQFLLNEKKLAINQTPQLLYHSSEGFSFCGIYFKERMRCIDPKKFEDIKTRLSGLVQVKDWNYLIVPLRDFISGTRRYYGALKITDQLIILDELTARLLAEKLNAEKEKGIAHSTAAVKEQLAAIQFFMERSAQEHKAFTVGVLRRADELSQKKKDPDGFDPAVTKKIERKKREYQKIWYKNADLVVHTRGSAVGKAGYAVVVRVQGKIRQQVDIGSIKNILIAAKGVSVSTDLIELCMSKNIRIDLFDELGKPYAVLVGSGSPVWSNSVIQISAFENGLANTVAKGIIEAKIKNQLSVLKYFRKNGQLQDAKLIAFNKEIERIEVFNKDLCRLDDKLDNKTLSEKLFGYEGLAASSYWACVQAIIPEQYEFTGRERRSSKDTVNMLFNYAYGILYSRITAAVLLTGLNPNISYIHREQRNKPTLVYDLIEQFRAPVADRAVIAMLTRKIKVESKNDILTDETRKELAKRVLERLNTEVLFRSEKITLNDVIFRQAKHLLLFLMHEEKRFKPYLMKW